MMNVKMTLIWLVVLNMNTQVPDATLSQYKQWSLYYS